MRVRASSRLPPATCPVAAASPRRSRRTAGPRAPPRRRDGISPERVPSAARRGPASLRYHVFVHSCRYLELTIFYHPNVIGRAGTPFASPWLRLQWRGGE